MEDDLDPTLQALKYLALINVFNSWFPCSVFCGSLYLFCWNSRRNSCWSCL